MKRSSKKSISIEDVRRDLFTLDIEETYIHELVSSIHIFSKDLSYEEILFC